LERERGDTCFPKCELLEDRTLLSASTWLGGGGDSNWFNGGNWAGQNFGFPFPADTARFLPVAADKSQDAVPGPSPFFYPVQGPIDIAGLDLDGFSGTITLKRPLIVTSAFIMHSGTIRTTGNGKLIIANTATICVWDETLNGLRPRGVNIGSPCIRRFAIVPLFAVSHAV
jgi:hypothetical protein